jgi:DNA topoisomerase VI subunit B
MAERIGVEQFFTIADHKLIVRNIFAMYHHRWDVIGETIQNAVDSVLKRSEEVSKDYSAQINIEYNARTKEIVVEDNGTGIPKEEVKRIVTPHVSLKSPLEASRGEFGVGLSFVAFCSNDFKLESTDGETAASLDIKNGYSWAMDDEGKEQLDILFDGGPSENRQPGTRIRVKPVRFPE